MVFHSFQKYDEDDYRRVRFLGKSRKQVNTRFAIDLINEVPPEPRKERVVSCDGGGGPTGHPRVYINLVIMQFWPNSYLLVLTRHICVSHGDYLLTFHAMNEE